MNIFVYSDESGVFDKVHNDIFVFGGVVLLSKDDKNNWCNKYIHAEESIRLKEHGTIKGELKATAISNKAKGKLYRSLNNIEKFGIVIHQKELLDNVFIGKKVKQRYLDWAYKIALKRKLEDMIERGLIRPEEVEKIFVYVDEHTTATSGIYDLKESLFQEFKYGGFNYTWNRHYPPLFGNLNDLQVRYCDSSVNTLVRASDIIANKLYHCAIRSEEYTLKSENFHIMQHPW